MIVGDRSEILQLIGEAIRKHRLQQNIPQKVLADRSGLSLTAVKHLERGEGATLGSFVQVCRTLGLDRWISELMPRDVVSPIAYADALKKTKAKERRRAHVEIDVKKFGLPANAVATIVDWEAPRVKKGEPVPEAPKAEYKNGKLSLELQRHDYHLVKIAAPKAAAPEKK